MAKPKLPKKNNISKESIPNPNVAVPTPDPNFGPPFPLTSAVAAAPVIESVKPETKKAARKPEIVRSEPRANLVPINIEEEIRRFAYLLSERRGFEPGHEAEDWLAAEHEVRQRYHQQSA